MFRKVLVANRGEIALRIIRALRELGIRSVAVHSEADASALHVKFADEKVCIGPAPSARSYLAVPSIISAAEITRADAIHPGYGFLAEDPEFAEVCEKCDIQWIGPRPDSMRLMGDKIRAREAMAKAGVPVLPGSGAINTEAELHQAVEQIGFPLILKAAAGGGGRGMKIVREPGRLVADWSLARTEAQAAFGNPDMYAERYCERPRHIEIQVVADHHGTAAHLGERECSVQRRHQKVVEEAPAASLDSDIRDQMTDAALKAVRAIGYRNLGTLEFLLDEDGQFYFMEMNTRLQVEHPVTELITGVDLVREQIRIAAGERLSFGTRRPRGHAIELRINAEDPETFAPWPGKITGLNLPGGLGVRVDTHIYDGYVVPPHYDSLLAKLVVHDDTREAALRRARRCLEEFVVEGIRTNLAFHRRIIDHPEFQAGRYDTGFVARLLAGK
ncbi:acetyl-CoA carboxylase biotin carboxylase subunit [Haliangium ochraceum]|uniref:Biotin carboxylase n=1 Tax=Haliangium ochraceum (strain DSM 14365 / JCM 11303 / SMP-2) TaxID=502025 RepID=D0LHN6_HALO1|nr:acetyl-CoA carboxylase biotin carboxylase subunit [Haliangium ochraceum]ACY12898.1 acetyl-CoA carboxylase, biotin carboxylase [Haliangium ochraceum DSM 14365]